jgi:hypothetical protein
MNKLLQIACLKKIAFELYVKMKRECPEVTCCHCLYNIHKNIKLLLEQDNLNTNNYVFFSHVNSKEVQTALAFFVYEELTKEGELFHDCFAIRFFEKELTKFSNNVFLSKIFSQIVQRIRKRDLSLMLNAFVVTFLNIVNIAERKKFISLFLTDSNMNRRYLECENLHKSIIQHNDDITLNYLA